MAELKVDHVDFGYDESKIVLHDVCLEIKEPGLYCIIGPNGVGKSTLVKCVTKIVTPLTGQIYIDGKETKDMSFKDVAELVGFVPAYSQDVFSMSVLETVMVGRYGKHTTKQEDINAAFRALKLMGVEDLSPRSFSDLSSGQHQRVSIARGLVREPEILILDEPTANLDVKYQVYVMEMLRAIAIERNMIILTISHDLNITAKYAHSIIMLARPGIVYKVGTPNEVITKENVEYVYGIECEVMQHNGYPLLIFGAAMFNDEESSSVIPWSESKDGKTKDKEEQSS